MKKKYGVLIGLLVLLVVAVYVNVRINKASENNPLPTLSIGVAQGAQAESASADAGAYFETFRADRQNQRDMEIEVLETIILNDLTDAETLADAQERKLTIVDTMEKEFTVESLLKAKGFKDAAVMFHTGSVNVVIKAETLSPQDVAQVLDIVCRETGEEAQNVKVSSAVG